MVWPRVRNSKTVPIPMGPVTMIPRCYPYPCHTLNARWETTINIATPNDARGLRHWHVSSPRWVFFSPFFNCTNIIKYTMHRATATKVLPNNNEWGPRGVSDPWCVFFILGIGISIYYVSFHIIYLGFRWPLLKFPIDTLACVTILLLTFPHSFSSYTLCMLLPHAYYFLFTFLFSSTDFLLLHAQPYCLCIASCTVRLLMHSPAQSCTVCLLMHSLLRHSLVTQYIRTG